MILTDNTSEKTLKAYFKNIKQKKKTSMKELYSQVFSILKDLKVETNYAVRDVHNVLDSINIEKKSFDSAVLTYFKEEINKRLV